MNYNFYPGCPIKVWRGFYWHHGIYIGDNRVIHYDGEVKSKAGASVCIENLRKFAAGGTIEINHHLERLAKHAPHERLRRAQARLGEANFNLVFNNCEHFVSWCLQGKRESSQVQFASSCAFVLFVGFALSRA